MNKLKSGLLSVSLFLAASFTYAQSLEDGKRFMYYERFKSAKTVFEKLVAANPNDVEAVYWLGQALILPEENSDLMGAKSLYQKALMNNSNSTLLLAGMGHTELLEGKTQDARNRFETAISLSQAKDKNTLNAVGFANTQAPNGDADYAVDKLKIATALKNMKDPDVWANLGDAYKKLAQGGPAQTAYETALQLNTNYARASYRIGKIYQSQGPNQRDIYEKYYSEAIAKDAAYAPVYENLYQLYYLTDVNKSAENLEKFLANTDADTKHCYYRATMKYAQGLFADCISKGNECIKEQGVQTYPNVYGIMAYAYDRLNDSVSAKSAFETYFQKQKPGKLGPTDYAKYAEILAKFPGNDSVAAIYIDKAVNADSTEKGKVELLKTQAAKFAAQKRYKEAADWYNRIVLIRKNPTKTDLFNAGNNYFRVGDYNASITTFNIYTQKFADDALGYFMLGKNKWAIDSTLEQGLANADFEKAIEVGTKDSVKYKGQLIGSYKYFVVYSVFIKDKAAALGYCDKVLALDAADAETNSNKATITAMNFNAPVKPAKSGAASGGTKPKEKTGGAKGGTSPKKK